MRALLTADVPAALRAEIAALADWTGGLAAVIGGQMADAVRLFDSAAAGLRSVGQADPAAQTQVPKIMALSMLGQHAQAADCAVAAQRDLLALGNLRAAARVSQNLGALQFRRDAYADAARQYREAAVLFARLRDHAHSVLADIGLADALAATGDFDEEAQWLAGQHAQARCGFEAALATDKRLQQWPVQQRCLTGLGLAALALGEPQAASSHFEAAIAYFEARRRALPGDEIRSAFLTDHLRPYLEQLRGALASGDGAQVLWQLERFRARALDDHQPDPADSAADDDTTALRDRLNWLYRRVQRLQDEGSPTSVPDDELRRTERELLERSRRRRLQAAAHTPAAGPGLPAVFSLAALQQAMAPGDALVAYGVLDDELLACVLTCERITLHRRLAPWSVVTDAVRATLFQLETLRHGAAPVRQHLPVLAARAQARLQGVHALVWAPLAPALAGIQRLLLVPHAQLGALPWAALTDGRQALAERFQIALAPSARAALRGLQRPPTAALLARGLLATLLLACGALTPAHAAGGSGGGGSGAASSTGSGSADADMPGEILVKLRHSEALGPLLAAYPVTLLSRFGARPIYRLKVIGSLRVKDVLARLVLEPEVMIAETNPSHRSPEARKNVPWAIGTATAYQAQWAPQALNLAEAQRRATGDGVRMAVLDTGVDASHPLLAGRLLPGHDFVDGDNDPAEGGSAANGAWGHATHVAGLVALVAPGARIMPLRVLDADGTGNAWVLAEAMLYALDPDGNPATDDGAHVINLSLGSLARTRLMDSIALLAACAPAVADDAIADRSDPGYRDDEQRCASSNGAVVVAASGNDASSSEKQYPAAEGAYGLL